MAIDVDALKKATDLVSVVGAYVSLKKQGREFKALCPFHADTSPSFYVVPAKGLCHCFSCGWSGDVIAFVQEIESLDFKEACERLGGKQEWKPKPITQSAPPLPDRHTSKPPAGTPPPNMAIRALGAPVKTWEYKDTDGGTFGYVARYEVEGRKEIRCWSWGGRGDESGYSWACGHFNNPRPLYGLDRLSAEAERPALVVEGEKTADAAQTLLPQYAAITWPGGANAWHKADWSPLAGRKVLLWPDADEPGRVCMEKLAALLADPRGLACSVRTLDTSSQPEGWDVADWTGTGAELIAWAKPRARDYAAPQQNPDPQGGVGAAPADAGNSSSAAAPPADAGPPESDAIPLEAYSDESRTHHATAPRNGAPAPPNGRSSSTIDGLVYINASQVIPRAVRWLWKGRIPRGKVSIIAGDPGLGKSQVCASIASIVTNGSLWPVDRTPCDEGSVVILSAEDDPEDTIRPRLEAAGADISRVTILQAVKYDTQDSGTAERTFNLGEDLIKLRELLTHLSDVRLVIIDPVSAYLGITDSHKNAEVRAMMAPLAALASNCDCSILLVSHLTKGQAGSVLSRIQGSVAFGAAARAVWGVTKDHDNPQRRLFMPMKNNLGRDDTGLAYTIESCRLEAPEDDEPIETSRIMWEPDSITISAEDAFSMHLNNEERGQVSDAKEFLRGLLMDGPMKTTDIKKDAEGAGHHWATIRRAKDQLGVTAKKDGFRDPWMWALPSP